MIVLAYLGVCLAIGVWASRRTTSASDFFLAGKRIGVWILGFAAFSTTASGFAFIGGPGFVYEYGTSSLWMCVPAGISFVWTGFVVAKRLRIFAELFDIMTLPDAIEARFGCRVCRAVTAIVIVLGVIAYLGTQLAAIGTVAENLFGVAPLVAIVVGVAVILFYSVAGGIMASLYTDLFQGVIMVFASLGVLVVAMSTAGDGNVLQAAHRVTDAFEASSAPQAIGPWGLVGPWMCVGWFFLFAFGGAGQPHLVTKYFMVRRVADLRHGTAVAAVAYFLCSLLWLSVGFVMRQQALLDPDLQLARPDDAAPQFLLRYAPPWLAGLVFAGLLAAIMSTADAFINLGAAVFAHDAPRIMGWSESRNELQAARISTVVITLGAALFAMVANSALLVVLGVISWGLFAVPLAPVVAIGFNWPRANRYGALASMIGGLVVYFLLEFVGRYPSTNPIYRIPHGVPAGTLALSVSCLLLIVVSWYTEGPPLTDRHKLAMRI